MNELIVKWLAAATVGLVVASALWLAVSVQTAQRGGGWQNHRPAGFAAAKKPLAPLHLAALPAQQAASSAVSSRAPLILR